MYIWPLIAVSIYQIALVLAAYWWPPPTADTFESEFEWVEDDPTFDCMVPICYYKMKLNCGAFIRNDLIVTSEIPLKPYFKWPTYLKVYMITDVYNYSRGWYAKNSVGDIWGKENYWVYWGVERWDHNPVHDLMFLYVNRAVGNRSNIMKRVPYYIPVARTYTIEEPSGWKTASFALTGWRHVEMSSKLVPIYYNEPVLVDCKEYFPKYWGHFICILNVDKYPVIQSGSPLIQNNKIFGIASFTLRRGKESIYAFTDLRPYRKLIYGFHKRFFATTTPNPASSGGGSWWGK